MNINTKVNPFSVEMQMLKLITTPYYQIKEETSYFNDESWLIKCKRIGADYQLSKLIEQNLKHVE